MKTCSKCNATAKTTKKQCPVCFDELEINEDVASAPSIYPPAKPYDDIANKNVFLVRLFFFLTISISSIVLFINFILAPGTPWSLIVIVSMFYIWILVRHTVISRRGNFEKILFQFLGILAVVMVGNYVAGSNQNWIWNFLIPGASIATITVLMFVILVNQKRADYVLSFFLMSIVLIGLSIILVTTNLDTFKILNFVNILFTGLFALGIAIFGFRVLKRSFHKTLHI